MQSEQGYYTLKFIFLFVYSIKMVRNYIGKKETTQKNTVHIFNYNGQRWYKNV